MPVSTRRQRHLVLIDAWNQNQSQPVCRLSPELILEIFLQARPDVFARHPNRAVAWRELVRYLVTITSIARHFRHIALNCGELWSVVGFSFKTYMYLKVVRLKSSKAYKIELAIMKVFLERARGCNLHFFFHTGSWCILPTRFFLKLAETIRPHIGRVRTFNLSLGASPSAWKRLYSLFNDAVNINKLSLLTDTKRYSRQTLPPLRDIHALHNLNELSLTGFIYDESFREVLGVVEVLHLNLRGADLRQWLGGSVRLKRLIIRGTDYIVSGSTDPNSLLQLEDLMYLNIGAQLYHSVAPRLSLPRLRHLCLIQSEFETRTREPKPQLCHHPFLRTLYIFLDRLEDFNLPKMLVLSNPQLEYLGMDYPWGGISTGKLLSELLAPSQGLVPPSGAATFPGPSLKYLRLILPDPPFHHNEELLKNLSSILSKAPHLELDLISWKTPPISGGLSKQLLSKVKNGRYTFPLDKLYERAEKGNA